MSQRVMAADIGNSAVKVAICAVDDLPDHDVTEQIQQRTYSLHNEDWIDEVCAWIDSTGADSGFDHWWVSTVNHAASDPLGKRVRAMYDANWTEVDHRSIPLRLLVDQPHKVGIDRLLGAAAAHQRYPKPAVVVDVGSAVTVDWIDSDDSQGLFCGGAILPGIRLQREALAAGTEALKEDALDFGEGPWEGFAPAKNTKRAIDTGVFAAIAGGIERLVRDYPAGRAEPPSRPPEVIVTGGDGPLIGEFLAIPHRLVPNLVCKGLFDLALRSG